MGKKRISDTFSSIRNFFSFVWTVPSQWWEMGLVTQIFPGQIWGQIRLKNRVCIKILAMFYGRGKVTLAVLSLNLLIHSKIKDNNIS